MIREYFSSISHVVDCLRSVLMTNADIIHVSAYELPKIYKTNEYEPITEIPVKYIEGKKALDVVLHSLGDFFLTGDDTESSRCVRRYPGLVVIRNNDVGVLVRELIEVINRYKTDLKQFRIDTFKTSKSRFEAMHMLIRSVMTEHLDRKIPYMTTHVRSVSHSWARKHSLFVVDPDELIKYLTTEALNPPAFYNPAKWGYMLSDEAALISRIQDKTSLRQKRTVKVHPIYNLLLGADGEATFKKQVKASLPLFVFQDETPKYNRLKDFSDIEQRRGFIESTLEDDPLIPRLNLYVKSSKISA